MNLQRLKTDNPDFAKLNEMITAMKGLLEDSRETNLTIGELCSFQDCDGTFKLFDSYQVPADARVDFCHMPTYIGAAILMKAHLGGQKCFSARLEKALKASLKAGLLGHGYDAEKGRIEALKVFIKGGMRDFLETQREICPEFHQTVHNILHHYNSCLLRKCTEGIWGEVYSGEWREITDKLHFNKRLYAAYGSNMDKLQMASRCRDAKVLGKAYLEDWVLTLPFYANIEKKKGYKTPALIWEITAEDENALDDREGYPDYYDKTEIIISIKGKLSSAMVYVMTDKYKEVRKKPRDRYKEQIIRGYRDAGFDEAEFQPEGQGDGSFV